MKYIIMCGGNYSKWEIPKQLTEICGEPIVARTIRLLSECGIKDIAISSNNDIFTQFGVPILRHDNPWVVKDKDNCDGWWVDAFYPTDEPTTYLFGDVVYSPEAIQTIIETKTDNIEYFASAPPYDPRYFKPYQEPFAFKVMDPEKLRQGIEDCKVNTANGMFWRHPISWELWTSINHGVLKRRRDVYNDRYTAIRDYTCDIDSPSDAEQFERIFNAEV